METTISNQITKCENRLADYADNLSHWFGSERDTLALNKPEMPFESLYVKMMLDKMNGEYRNLLRLQAQLTEFSIEEPVNA
jgi:hypothetical protein